MSIQVYNLEFSIVKIIIINLHLLTHAQIQGCTPMQEKRDEFGGGKKLGMKDALVHAGIHDNPRS